MAYSNAAALLDLASYVSANRTGVTYGQIEARFDVEHRQVQRLVSAPRDVCPDLEEDVDDEGRKLFRLRRAALRALAGITAAQSAALDHAVAALAEFGEGTDELRRLRGQVSIALSGGESRAIAFHLGCLRTLDRVGILRGATVLSTVSADRRHPRRVGGRARLA